ncbi:hypothetical protein DFJ73DRAFT_861566 [Zopfochytrium polystomum]|nr:hypothetical protein DFJ73DRAFT_861566 [Zopfochytrium polystomum]
MLFRRVVEFDEHLGYIGDEETGDTEFEEDRYSDDQAQAGSRGPESWSRGEAASPFRTTRSSSTGKKGGSSGNNKSSSPTCKRDRLHMLPVYECHPRILIPATPSPLASTLSFEFATGLPTPRLNPEASQLVLYRPLPVSRLSVGTCEDSGLPTPPPTSVAPSPLALSSLSLQSSPSSLSIGDHIIRSLWNKQRVSVSLGLMQLDDEDRRVRVKIGRTMDVD